MRSVPQRLRSLQAWLIWCGPALLAAGLFSTGILQTLPHAHGAELIAIAATAGAVSALLRRFATLGWADGFALIFLLAWIAFVGPLPVLATLLLALASLSAGLMLAGRQFGPAATAIAGAALLAAVIGWLLPIPLHTRATYLALLLGLCALARKRLTETLCGLRFDWRTAVAADPESAAFAMLCVGLASVGCWIPTVQFDDLAYHLGLPSQLAALGYYRMDVHSQIWALAPWAGDVVQAIAQVMAGREARGAVDGAWLAAIAALSWQLAAAIGLSVRARWMCTALAASQPLLAALLGGMQAELPATAAVLALALIVARAGMDAEIPCAIACALLAGLLIGLKTGFVALIAPLLLIVLWKRRHKLSARAGATALALFVLVAGSSYVYAGLLTGNPLFPLLNQWFQSPLLPATNLQDPRWSVPIGWDFPWRLTFYSREFGEGWNGLAGFTLLALLGALPAALLLRRLRWLAVAALLSGAAALATVHYFRYAFPALVLLIPCLAGAAFAVVPERAASRLLVGIVGLNLLFQGASFWTLHSGAVTREVGALSTEPVLRRFAPERLLIAAARQRQSDGNVLLCGAGEPFAAELAGHGFTVTHYDPELEALARAADDDPSGVQWHALFAHTNARFAITDHKAGAALRYALREAHPLLDIGTAQLWELPSPAGIEPDLAQLRDAAAHLHP
jgi:hypothetical protein